MAYQNYSWCRNVIGLRGKQKNALFCLADEADKNGKIEALTLGRIARQINVSYEYARKLIADLRHWGFISIEYREDDRGRYISNGYQLDMSRLYPRAHPGARIGSAIWSALLDQLAAQNLDPAEIFLFRNQVREAFFDASRGASKSGQRRGVVYPIAETDIVRKPFRQNLKHFLKLRRAFPPYLIDYYQLLQRPQFQPRPVEDGKRQRPQVKTITHV